MSQDKEINLIRHIFEMNYPDIDYQVTFDDCDKCYYVNMLGHVITTYNPVDFTPMTHFHPKDKKQKVLMEYLESEYKIYDPFDNFIPNINIVIRQCVDNKNLFRNMIRFEDLKVVSASGSTYVEC